MGSQTSISMSEETKAMLEDVKRDGETWDGCLQRLANSTGSTDEGAEIGEQLNTISAENREILNAINQLPDRIRSELQ